MKKVSFVVGRDYQDNRIFDLNNKFLNRDNCLYPYFLLKKEFLEKGYVLETSDRISPEEADIILYNEMPKRLPDSSEIQKSFLLLFETELIREDNWNLDHHKFFNKIFTWNDKFVDGKKYIKFNFPNEIKSTSPSLVGRVGFLTSISGNKTSRHPLELYSKRLESIKWFSKHHPEDFKYYGIGWDYSFNLRMQKVFRKLKILDFIPKNQSPSYGGKVDEKFLTLKTYKFALCYENGRDIDGYITEKIFDCLFAGTIPIYWGAGNVSNYIPKNCFIERTQFKSDKELYQFLKKMTDEEILVYQKNIETYLKSDQVKVFSNEYFSKNIIETILNE